MYYTKVIFIFGVSLFRGSAAASPDHAELPQQLSSLASLSQSDWRQLNDSVSGSVFVGKPMAIPCFGRGPDNKPQIPDLGECTKIQINKGKSAFIGDHFGGYDFVSLTMIPTTYIYNSPLIRHKDKLGFLSIERIRLLVRHLTSFRPDHLFPKAMPARQRPELLHRRQRQV
jgi:hypothetical protein